MVNGTLISKGITIRIEKDEIPDLKDGEELEGEIYRVSSNDTCILKVCVSDVEEVETLPQNVSYSTIKTYIVKIPQTAPEDIKNGQPYLKKDVSGFRQIHIGLENVMLG